MDDIARDPNSDGVSVEASERLRRKGPIDELAVRASPDDDGLDEADTSRDERASRLPVVLPLPADDLPADELSGDDELADDPLLEAALGAASALPVPDDPAEEPPADPAGEEPDDGPSPLDAPLDDAADLERDLEHGDVGKVDAEATPPLGDDANTPGGPRPDPSDEVLPEVAEPITDPDRLTRVVLGLLLTVREGLTVLRLAQTCETTQEAVRGALVRIQAQLGASGFPLELTGQGESLKLWTSPDVFPYLEKVKGIKKNERLSPAALETLAVVAYRQPVFRAEIEAIRGVKVGPMLRTLLDCKLVKIVGRADVPGRPLQYGTTQQFLDRFGLATIQDLPSVKEFKGLQG